MHAILHPVATVQNRTGTGLPKSRHKYFTGANGSLMRSMLSRYVHFPSEPDPPRVGALGMEDSTRSVELTQRLASLSQGGRPDAR